MPDTTSNTARIKRHWIVSAFQPGDELDQTDYGQIGQVSTTLYTTLEAAKTRARELAADAPGTFYVVYEAEWYAFTDITPVALRKVGDVGVA